MRASRTSGCSSSGEFGAILKIASKEQNTLSDQLRDAWDGKDRHNKSKGSPCKATDPHVSVIAHTNDSDLRLFLTENAMANGFANRFMFFAVKRSKSLPFGGKVDEDAFAEVASGIAKRLAYPRAVGELGWSYEAAALWRAEYDRLSRERYGLAGSITGRAEAHALRLAMMYAMLDGVSQIDREHLAAALAVWAYAEATAYRLFGGRTGDPLADDCHASCNGTRSESVGGRCTKRRGRTYPPRASGPHSTHSRRWARREVRNASRVVGMRKCGSRPPNKRQEVGR